MGSYPGRAGTRQKVGNKGGGPKETWQSFFEIQ